MTPDAIAAILVLLSKVEGTPYIPGGNSVAGTDCSGLASWVANTAAGRDPFSGRFSTADEASELASRGFVRGAAPNALVIGWNASHTAVTLPDGTAVSSGEGGGVKFGGQGAYHRQFTDHMHLPVVTHATPEAPVPPGTTPAHMVAVDVAVPEAPTPPEGTPDRERIPVEASEPEIVPAELSPSDASTPLAGD